MKKNLIISEKEIRQGYYFKFNTGMLLRADLKTQVESLVKGISGGLYTNNEARGYLDLEAKEGGDHLIVNGSMVRVEQVGIQYDKTQNSEVENNSSDVEEKENDLEGGENDEQEQEQIL